MTVREQLVAWGVDVDALLATTLDVEPVEGPRDGQLAIRYVQELGREILRRRTKGRDAVVQRQARERDELEKRHRRELEALSGPEPPSVTQAPTTQAPTSESAPAPAPEIPPAPSAPARRP